MFNKEEQNQSIMFFIILWMCMVPMVLLKEWVIVGLLLLPTIYYTSIVIRQLKKEK